ncbi:MAG: MBL fold metallo-hydrolase [Elusimicrobia bacterium RIFOXYB2_FULL_49_7]|nr:MAG: MBL fold metallo-hydrolase [Elusimicrobia bacterium RIFOXYB2_FULL_49_7]
MKLTVLIDNHTLIDRYFRGEPGLAFHLQEENHAILFDTGYSDALIQNAWKLGIDLLQVDTIVLSHGHSDHTWGLTHLLALFNEAAEEKRPHKRPRLIAHPDIFCPRISDKGVEYGMLLEKEKLERRFDLQLSREPLAITDKLFFLGQIERRFSFEGKQTLGRVLRQREWEPDAMTDDSALAYHADQGIVVISGCSHSGICNIVEQAKRVCKKEPVAGIIGGFHLLRPAPEQLNNTIVYLKTLSLPLLHACHCTDLASKVALSSVVPVADVGIGFLIEWR